MSTRQSSVKPSIELVIDFARCDSSNQCLLEHSHIPQQRLGVSLCTAGGDDLFILTRH